MMSCRVVHAGAGYQYLLRSVATNDADPNLNLGAESDSAPQKLHDYYAAKGTPPGRWRGRGLDGLNSATVTAGAVVTEDQMAALYGEGLHPDTDEMMATGVPLNQCKLGRKFPIYTDGKPVLVTLAALEKDFRETNNRRPDEAERSELALTAGRAHFADVHGRPAADGKEIISWVNREQHSVRQAVSGVDLTFSPAKSISVLWGLADRDTANRIAAIHHRAVADTLDWIEDNALYTRTGSGGIRQVKTGGMIAAEFTHFDTRSGDMDLHSHVLVANKVQAPDGSWKAIDQPALFEHAVTASERYNLVVRDMLARELGLEFTARYRGASACPVYEVAGIDDEVIEAFSSRRAMAKPVYDRMVADYVAKHGRQPSTRTNHQLWQAAILQTRDAKRPAESLDQLRDQWRDHARKIIPTRQIDRLVAHCQKQQATRPVLSADRIDAETIETLSRDALHLVMSRRAVFKKTHITTAVAQQLHQFRFATATDRERIHHLVVETIMTTHAVCLTPPEILDLPHQLQHDTGPFAGAGVDRRANSTVYSTQTHLDRERMILEAASTPQPLLVDDRVITDQLNHFARTHGFNLNDGQARLARHLLTCGTLLAVGVGPAGTGKTTSMKLVVDCWTTSDRRVIGLAPSAAAAKVLEADIGTTCRTIDSLTYHYTEAIDRGLTPEQAISELPVDIKDGDMLLVDEAGMASTDRIATLLDIATAAGATVRMVGDPAQLDSVETGGMFRTLTNTPGTPVLDEVMRFGDDTTQAAATLDIRNGNPDGLDVHDHRGWITHGTRETMITRAVQAFLADEDAGCKSLVIAPTNADVTTINAMIQTHKLTCHTVDHTRTRTLSDGLKAGRGDLILTRKNKLLTNPDGTGTRVLNGQLLRVSRITNTGSIIARDLKTGTPIRLPGWYIDEATQLGYAATIHRCQGATVDTTHAIVDPSMDRNGLYVALTRGKTKNRLYVDTSAPLDPDAGDAHLHMSGDTPAGSARDVLERIVARDTSCRSAIDELTRQMDHATTGDRVAALYAHGVELATEAYTHQVVPQLIDTLPVYTAAQLQADTDGVEAIEHAVTFAANRGIDARDLWVHASDDIDWADSPGRLIASRIRDMTQPSPRASDHAFPDRDRHATPPPVIPGADMELALWLENTYTTLTTPAAAATETTTALATHTAADRVADNHVAETAADTLSDWHARPDAPTTRIAAPTDNHQEPTQPVTIDQTTATADTTGHTRGGQHHRPAAAGHPATGAPRAAAVMGPAAATNPTTADRAPAAKTLMAPSARTVASSAHTHRADQAERIRTIRNLDTQITRYTTAIHAAERAVAAGNTPDGTAAKLQAARDNLARLSARRDRLAESLPDENTWEKITTDHAHHTTRTLGTRTELGPDPTIGAPPSPPTPSHDNDLGM
ncbi:MobF family relaxase [Corynebacterium bovis]|uniref:MobF family relaxase n=1 Tax=Corynebacterium bovis TaxID=36808 RepID=UPI0031398F6C